MSVRQLHGMLAGGGSPFSSRFGPKVILRYIVSETWDLGCPFNFSHFDVDVTSRDLSMT